MHASAALSGLLGRGQRAGMGWAGTQTGGTVRHALPLPSSPRNPISFLPRNRRSRLMWRWR